MLAKWHRHHGITVNFRPLSGANRASLWFFALSARPLVDRNLNLSDLLRFQQTQHLASVCQALGRTKTYPPGGMCALDLSHINISCKFSTAHHIQPMENASCSTATWAHRRGFSFLKGKCFFFSLGSVTTRPVLLHEVLLEHSELLDHFLFTKNLTLPNTSWNAVFVMMKCRYLHYGFTSKDLLPAGTLPPPRVHLVEGWWCESEKCHPFGQSRSLQLELAEHRTDFSTQRSCPSHAAS